MDAVLVKEKVKEGKEGRRDGDRSTPCLAFVAAPFVTSAVHLAACSFIDSQLSWSHGRHWTAAERPGTADLAKRTVFGVYQDAVRNPCQNQAFGLC